MANDELKTLKRMKLLASVAAFPLIWTSHRQHSENLLRLLHNKKCCGVSKLKPQGAALLQCCTVLLAIATHMPALDTL
jgi:hypothetical protein